MLTKRIAASGNEIVLLEKNPRQLANTSGERHKHEDVLCVVSTTGFNSYLQDYLK